MNNNVTFSNDTSSSSSMTDMPIHSVAEQWVVALIMVCCLLFLLGLVMVLFSSRVRLALRTIGYTIQATFLRFFCIPCRCCYKISEKHAQWIERRARRLKTRIMQEDEDGSWSDSEDVVDTDNISMKPYLDL